MEEEKEVYDDEQINSLIARSEEELLEFEKMDEERYKHEKFGDTRIYTESDYIPLWIQNDELKYEEERPRRKRALVMKDLPSDSEEFYEYDDSENEESTKKWAHEDEEFLVEEEEKVDLKFRISRQVLESD